MTNGKKLSEKSIGAVCAVVSIGAFIILWYWGTQATQLGLLIPGPFDVLKAVGAGIVGKVGRHSILAHAGYSLLRVMIGFIVGSLVGVALGLLMGWYRIAEAIFNLNEQTLDLGVGGSALKGEVEAAFHVFGAKVTLTGQGSVGSAELNMSYHHSNREWEFGSKLGFIVGTGFKVKVQY